MRMACLILLLPCTGVIVTGCADPRYAAGTLRISYRLNRVQGVVPSYQTAIWLEDEAGALRTLMVTPYLSSGGYADGGTCRRWAQSSRWDEQPAAVLDAVTQATPELRAQILNVSCQRQQLEPGTYNYYVETHLVEKYNILASGRVTLGGAPGKNTAVISYEPDKPLRGSDALIDVRAQYEP